MRRRSDKPLAGSARHWLPRAENPSDAVFYRSRQQLAPNTAESHVPPHTACPLLLCVPVPVGVSQELMKSYGRTEDLSCNLRVREPYNVCHVED